MKKINVSNFYNNEYKSFAVYCSFRTLPNYIDGLKNGERKIIYVVDKNNIKTELKLSHLMAETSKCGYMHGESSLYGSIVSLAVNYRCSNWINLLQPIGIFGNLFNPKSSGAARYIFTKKSNYFDLVFSEKDKKILIEQSFEGEKVEYKYFLPILPMVLVNGAIGIGVGFACKILPRDPKIIIDRIKNYLKTNKLSKEKIPVSYKGFNGSIFNLEDNKVEVQGKIERINSYKINITEIPVWWDLASYTKELNNLLENKIIKDFEDKSENDNYLFELSVSKEFSDQSDDKILNILKLVSRETENFTCVDENNAIREFKSEIEILEAYIKIRLEYYKKRKEYQLSTLKDEIKILNNRALFIDGIINNKIFINNKPKTEIEKQLETLKFDKEDNNFNYLLNMNIYSLTKEKYEELKKQIKDKENEFNNLLNLTIENIWLKELDELEKVLNKS